MRRKELTIPTILGLFLAVGGLISGLWLLGNRNSTSVKAAAGEEPRQIKITNVNDAGFTVSWVTDKAVAGFVRYGEASQNIEQVVSDERDQQKGMVGNYFTHYTTIKDLKPSTGYAFQIGSGVNLYDQGGVMYRVNTGATLGNPPLADVAYGTVVTSNREFAEGAIVYLEMPETTPQSALVKVSGAWVIPLSTARSADLKSFAIYSKDATSLKIAVQGGGLGTASVQVSSRNDSPVPEIVLGSNQDMASGSNISQASPVSKLTSGDAVVPTEAGELKLTSPVYGEKINISRPVIMGRAPVGTKITIEIHSSNTLLDKVIVGKDGTFSFVTPTDLTPGNHTLTVSANINGVNQSISRDFVVYAAGESDVPYYSATPSATLAPTISPTIKPGVTVSPTLKPTPTAKLSPTVKPSPTLKLNPTPKTSLAPLPTITLKPTVKPSPTLKITPTVTVRPTANVTGYTTISPTKRLVPTGNPLVEQPTGNDEPTLILLGLGVMFVSSGVWWYRRSA